MMGKKSIIYFVLFFAVFITQSGASEPSARKEDYIHKWFPEKYSTVEAVQYNSNSDKWIFLIRDAHFSSEAQKNTGKILASLFKYGCLDLILTEGACGKIDMSILKNYPDKDARDQVTDYLLNTGSINGAEFFAATCESDMVFEGIEEALFYEKNISSLRKVLAEKPDSIDRLDLIREVIATCKKSFRSPELIKFEQWKNEYESGVISIGEYISRLTGGDNIDKLKYPNLALALEFEQSTAKISFPEIYKEEHECLSGLRNKIPQSLLQTLLRQRVEFQMGSLSAYVYYSNIAGCAEKYLGDNRLYKNITLYVRALSKQKNMDFSVIETERKKIQQEFTARHAQSEEEKKVYVLENRCELLRDYFELKLNPHEAKSVIENKDQFTSTGLRELIKSVAPHDITASTGDISTDKLFEDVMQFYSLALERDILLAKNAIRRITDYRGKYTVVFAGGFHTQGMKEIFEKTGLNVAVIKPKMPDISADYANSDYYRLFIDRHNNNLDKYIGAAINSIAIPRWLSSVPIGISEPEKNIKLVETAVYLISAHAQNLIGKSPLTASPEVIEAVNNAIKTLKIDVLEAVSLKSIKRYSQYREYEFQINGNPLFFYFRDEAGSLTWNTIDSDIKSILSNNVEFGTKFSVAASTEPIRFSAQNAIVQTGLQDDAFLRWAKEQVAGINKTANTATAKVDLSAPAVILVSREGNDIAVSLIALGKQETQRSIIYQDKIPVSVVSPEYLLGIAGSIRSIFRSRFSISPHTIVISQDNQSSSVVSIDNTQEFSRATKPFLSQTTDYYKSEESFADFPFETIETEKQSHSDMEIIQRLIRYCARQQSFKEIFSIAQKTTNKRILTIISGSLFYEELRKTFPKNIKAKPHEVFNTISKNILLNKNAPKESLMNILSRPDFAVTAFQYPFIPDLKTNVFKLILAHPSTDAQLLDTLAGKIKEIDALPKGIIGYMLGAIDKYIPLRLVFDNFIGSFLAKHGLLGRFMINYFRISVTRTAKKELINHNKTSIETVQKLFFINDMPTALAIAQSKYPQIVADIKSGAIRRAVIENPNTSLDILIKYMDEKDSPEIRRKIAAKLALHPDLSADKIKKLAGTGDFNILIHLFATLNGMKTVPENESFIKTTTAAVFNIISEMIPSLDINSQVLLADTFLKVDQTQPHIRASIDKHLQSLALASAKIAELVSGYGKYVNPQTTGKLLEKYSDTGSYNRIVLENIARRTDINSYLLTRLDALNDAGVIKALLSNDLVAPVFSDEDLPKIGDKFIPLRISEKEVFSYIKEMHSNIGYLAHIARKPVLTPNITIYLFNLNRAPIQAEFAAKESLTPGLASILASSDSPVVRALLSLNPVTPPESVQKIAADVFTKGGGGKLFSGMTVREMDYYLERFPQLKIKDSLLDILLRNTKMILDPEVIDLYASRGLTQFICHLIRQLAMESLENAGSGKAEQAFINMSYLLFTGMEFNKLKFDQVEFDFKEFDKKLSTASLNKLHLDYAPPGTLFTFANAAYVYAQELKTKNPERAKHVIRLAQDLYDYSISNKNDPAAMVAKHYLGNKGYIPQPVLSINDNSQVILFDLHNAQPFSTDDSEEIIRFFNTVKWDTISYENRLLLNIASLILRDSVRQGILGSGTALKIFNDLAEKGISLDAWQQQKTELLREIVLSSNLKPAVKEDLIGQLPDQIEFFLRCGSDGLLNYNRYRKFFDNLIIDNIPEQLHHDMARSVWFELISLTHNQLFIEPHYITHLSLIRFNGEVVVGTDSFKISFPVVNPLEMMPADSTIRAELGHIMDFALFRSKEAQETVYYSPFGEFQDRSAMLYLPADLDDSILAKPVVELYKNHDNAMIAIFDRAVELAGQSRSSLSRYLWSIFNTYKPADITDSFFYKNMHQIITVTEDPAKISPLEKRLIGESLYRAVIDNPEFSSQIKTAKTAKDAISKLHWNTRVFFEGGTYMTTYGSAYPQILPPILPITGAITRDLLDKQEAHVSGEWLSFFFRSQIREMLRTGKLTHQMLAQFYRTAIYYLHNTVYKNGVPKPEEVIDAIRNLDPDTLFSDIEKREVKGKVIASAKETESVSTVIAKPEKMVLNAFTRLADNMFFERHVTFAQLVGLVSHFYINIYPEFIKTAVDTKIDLTRQPETLKLFANIIFKHLNGLFSDVNAVEEYLLAFMNKPHKNAVEQTVISPVNQAVLDLAQAQRTNSQVEGFLTSRQKNSGAFFDKSVIILDFDRLFLPDNPAVCAKLLASFNLMVNSIFDTSIERRMEVPSTKRFLFYSASKTEHEIADLLSMAGLDPDLYSFAGRDNPEIKNSGLKKYLTLNSAISFSDTIFVGSHESGELADMFAEQNAVVFNFGHTTDLNSFGLNLSALAGLLKNNVLPVNAKITSISRIAGARLGMGQEKAFDLSKLISTTGTGTIAYSNLAGLVIELPQDKPNTTRPNPRELRSYLHIVDSSL